MINTHLKGSIDYLEREMIRLDHKIENLSIRIESAHQRIFNVQNAIETEVFEIRKRLHALEERRN